MANASWGSDQPKAQATLPCPRSMLEWQISFAARSHQVPEALGKIMNCLVSEQFSVPRLSPLCSFLGLLLLPRRHKLPSAFHYWESCSRPSFRTLPSVGAFSGYPGLRGILRRHFRPVHTVSTTMWTLCMLGAQLIKAPTAQSAMMPPTHTYHLTKTIATSCLLTST